MTEVQKVHYSKTSELRPVVGLRESVRYLGVAAIVRSVFCIIVLVGFRKPVLNSEVSAFVRCPLTGVLLYTGESGENGLSIFTFDCFASYMRAST